MMNVQAISDLHGYFPDIPPCDLLLLGGDYCPTNNEDQQERYLRGPFAEYLRNIKARYIVGIAGNHDFALQRSLKLAHDLPWTYLQDSVVDLEGVVVYGTPWSIKYGQWVFQKSDYALESIYQGIPEGLDILLSHGPAYRQLDKTLDNDRAGSFALLERINKAKPDSVVCGHIHEGRGISDNDDGIRFYNVSHVNVKMDPTYGTVHIPLRAE
jgi:Icc-related predicted phosphoesterase